MLKLKSVNFDQHQFQSHTLNPADAGQTEWLIGRNPTCDLVLTNPEVSRIHAQIVYSKEAYYFVDVGSTSGSLLNGENVPVNDKRLLHPGDLLQVGAAFLHVEELASPEAIAAQSNLNLQQVVCTPELPWTGKPLTCFCYRIIQETPDTKTFCFKADPPVLFTFLPGQFTNLEVVIDGKPVIRPYSISSSPTRPHHLSLTVKRVHSPSDNPEVSPGLVSNWLHDELKVGDRVRLIGGAMGNFTCLPNLPTKLLCISAGSGITPMMSMSRWLQDTLVDSDVVFLHSARTPKDIPFRRELEIMVAQMPNLRLAITTTQIVEGESWMGLTGRISESMLRLVVPDLWERSVFVCGPNKFMADIKAILEAMEFPMHNYREESFGDRPQTLSAPESDLAAETPTFIGSYPQVHDSTNPPSSTQKTSLSEAASPTVNFASVGRTISTDGSLSILEIAEQEGILIPSACRAGACGACKIRTQQGAVRYVASPHALTTIDKQSGYILACIAHPTDQVVVEA